MPARLRRPSPRLATERRVLASVMFGGAASLTALRTSADRSCSASADLRSGEQREGQFSRTASAGTKIPHPRARSIRRREGQAGGQRTRRRASAGDSSLEGTSPNGGRCLTFAFGREATRPGRKREVEPCSDSPSRPVRPEVVKRFTSDAIATPVPASVAMRRPMCTARPATSARRPSGPDMRVRSPVPTIRP